MRIGYFADGPWAHLALEAIEAEEDLEVSYLVLRHGAADPVLGARAAALGVPCFVPPKVNDPAFVAELGALGAELLVSMSYDQILHRPLRDLFPRGAINCHAGALPFYRGRNVLNWVLINGEDRLGVTVHHIDDGIDTGDIIEQDFLPIGEEDDYASILERASACCAGTLLRALRGVRDGTARRRLQREIHPVGFYCPQRLPGDEWLDWSWESRRLHDFVRALVPPGPAARCRDKGRTLAVLKTRLIEDAPAYRAIPGAVVGRNDEGVVVKTGDSTIELLWLAGIDDDGSLGEPLRPRYRLGTRLQTGRGV